MSSMWRLGFISSVLLVSVIAVCRFDGALGSQNSQEAYVTLLYGDEFLLGVRVLGKSIRDTGSTKDMVALVSDGVSNYAKKLLQADGWIVKTISLLENPNQVRPTRFWGVYTKLKIFNMTDYKKVVYLDADTIVVKNIEDLFKCQKFCANLKHSERLNSGVMVVEPSEEVFKDMMTKVNTMYSYTGGDQGFLNSYFPDFANARIFDPYASAEELKSRPIPQMERLSTLYNADVGLYMLANKWMVDEAELRVIHYTLGPLKPWDWWTHWLVKPVDVWQNARIKLDETLPGTGGGQNPKDKLLITFLILLPLVFLMFCYYRSYLQTRSLFDHIRHIYYKLRSGGVLGYSSITSSTISSNQQVLPNAANKVPVFLGAMSVVVCIMAALFSLALSFSIVPRQVMPWTGLLLVYEWTFTLFFILFGSYLHVVHHWGKYVANQTASFSSNPESLDNDSRKGHLREMSSCDVAACYYGLGMASLALAVPLLPCLLGVTALFVRVGLMVAGGLILVSFMTYASEHLSSASILFIDQPADTGYSYSNTLKGYISNDTLSTRLCYDFLKKWLIKHPHYLKNPLYIVGESYSGITLPLIVNEVYKVLSVQSELKLSEENWSLNELISHYVQEEERLKQDKTKSAYFASTSKCKNRKKDNGATDTAPQKKQHKESNDPKAVCYFYKIEGHIKKHCTNYHAWCTKKKLPELPKAPIMLKDISM
ncbi:UNVERIFIED_CONTAM: Inositol phosphorylceramide glucuronosyltransferase 1 [Sesamum calycinum]|uniref:Inositol phosphorylceramide glucuronosyltransferase 1 n=1 Tax=Sesamum calycinum TaxID=2727403 RepID=A0AAW2LT07_9LAMI